MRCSAASTTTRADSRRGLIVAELVIAAATTSLMTMDQDDVRQTEMSMNNRYLCMKASFVRQAEHHRLRCSSPLLTLLHRIASSMLASHSMLSVLSTSFIHGWITDAPALAFVRLDARLYWTLFHRYRIKRRWQLEHVLVKWRISSLVSRDTLLTTDPIAHASTVISPQQRLIPSFTIVESITPAPVQHHS
jgi:hypothetical protein